MDTKNYWLDEWKLMRCAKSKLTECKTEWCGNCRYLADRYKAYYKQKEMIK